MSGSNAICPSPAAARPGGKQPHQDVHQYFASVAGAARMLNLSGCRIRQLLHAERLAGQKLNGKAWAIPISALQEFHRTMAAQGGSRRGRPRK